MGKRGPLPKEDGKRQRQRSQTNLRLLEQHDPAAPIPSPPDGLSEARLAGWQEFFESPLAGLVKPTDLSVVRRLWTYYQQHDDLTRIFAKSKLVTGSQGQPRMNPAHDALMKMETSILRLENELGLTPSARLRLGITFADSMNSLDQLNARIQADRDDEDDLWGDVL